jgi:superfamily I DNA/RNA helicase
VWFDIVKMLVKSNTGHLFLAADPTQGFLRQGISWKSLGLEVRGRSYHLNRSYRTTRPILNFATRFYQIRVPDDAEKTDILIPDFRNMPRGRKPQIISLSSSQDEVQRIANETTALVQKGTQKEDILILHTDAIAAKQMIDTIDRNLGRGAALDPKDSHPGNYIRVTTVNAGTGLEAPIVFLAGLNRSFEEENGLHLSDHDRTEMILNNTRKIYMAATRAGQRLVVSVVGKTPMIFARLTDEGFSEITD